MFSTSVKISVDEMTPWPPTHSHSSNKQEGGLLLQNLK